MTTFTDRSAIVTGGARGIGKGLVLGLASEGVEVAIADIDTEQATEVAADISAETDTPVKSLDCDVTDFESAKAMCEAAIEEFTTVDILVNNVGFWTTKPFTDTGPNDWARDLGICLDGTIHCTRGIIDHMIENEYGRILNIVSDAGRIGEPHLTVYSGAKAGVIGFGRALAKEVARFDITVNNLALGVVQTPGSKDFIEAFGKDRLVKQYPMGRLGTPEDALLGALFFLQDNASYVTGQTVSVSGGYTTV